MSGHSPGSLRCILSALALGLALAACAEAPTGHSDADRAKALVQRFQQALLARDTGSLHKCLRRNARPLLPQLLDQPLAGRQPLEVLGVEVLGAQYKVRVRDPGQDSGESYFLCCIEDGAMRLDLLDTARQQQRIEREQLAEPVFVPSRMTPEQRAMAARFGLEQGK